MAGITAVGGFFSLREELLERLHQGPRISAQPARMGNASQAPPTRWTLASVRANIDWLNGYSLSGVWYWLKRNGVRLRMARQQHWSPDAEYLSKRDHLLACLEQTAQFPGQFTFLFLDEMSYYRWPQAARNWMGDTPQSADSGIGNNSQWRIIGALNALTGQVTYRDNYIVGRQQLIELYALLNRTYPASDRIFVAQDNWPVHKHPDVLQALSRYPRIEPVWLPTYAPWLNPIEKLWRWLRQDVLKLHRSLADWKYTRQQVRDFLHQFADGSEDLLHYVGLLHDGLLARACLPLLTDFDC